MNLNPFLKSIQYLGQPLAIRPKVNFTANTNHRPANQARLLEHQLDQFIIAKLLTVQAQAFKTGTAKVEHLRSRFALKQVLYFCAIERILKEITLIDFDPLLRKKRLRFSAGISFHPAIKIDLHSAASFP